MSALTAFTELFIVLGIVLTIGLLAAYIWGSLWLLWDGYAQQQPAFVWMLCYLICPLLVMLVYLCVRKSELRQGCQSTTSNSSRMAKPVPRS